MIIPLLPNAKTKKYPLLAALLNVFPGVGYAYNGKRNFLAFTLFITIPLGFLNGWLAHTAGIDVSALDTFYANLPFHISFIDELIVLLPLAGFMYDAYQEAAQLNKENGHHM